MAASKGAGARRIYIAIEDETGVHLLHMPNPRWVVFEQEWEVTSDLPWERLRPGDAVRIKLEAEGRLVEGVFNPFPDDPPEDPKALSARQKALPAPAKKVSRRDP